ISLKDKDVLTEKDWWEFLRTLYVHYIKYYSVEEANRLAFVLKQGDIYKIVDFLTCDDFMRLIKEKIKDPVADIAQFNVLTFPTKKSSSDETKDKRPLSVFSPFGAAQFSFVIVLSIVTMLGLILSYVAQGVSFAETIR
ncbi:MAG TPA: hypothetical protein PKH98_06205, partial [Candidatus Omnitrophota bacterium]|nr:hypothetical protein [Candidatus Omnitrophota bacterium]